jgi:glycosyltransferase involved in cell wall biosynthesis
METLNKQNTITVLIAVYNETDKFLRKSIESILHQSFSDFEFIIINDGTADKRCLEIINEYAKKDKRIRLIDNEENIGLVKSLNKGLKEAKGEYIARIDSDDIADLHRLKKQLRFMENNPDCVLCGSWSYIIDENDDIIGKKKFFTNYEEIKKKLIYFNFFTHSSLFFRKDVALEYGGYNEKIKKAQDYDFILKISAKNKIANIPEFLCFNRIHSKSITSNGKKKQEWYAIISRFRAVFLYGYPRIYFLKIIPAVFYFLFIPYFFEKIIFKFLWKK